MDPNAHDNTPALAQIPVSCLILTKDEQFNMDAVLQTLSFSDDIVVLDSMSDDDTVKIAQATANVRVFKRPFDTEYKQRNFGLHDIDFKYSWVYICDADERVPADLRDEISRVVTDSDSVYSAYRLRYKNMYLGKWIKYATSYPVWIIRLVQPLKVAYEKRATNVHPIVKGEIGELDNHFIHYSFNKGLRHWFAKHNFYSDRESVEGFAVRGKGMPALKQLIHSDPIRRRRAIKNLSFFLRGRGFFRFFYSFFLRGGGLDRLAGFHYCAMISMYEYWIELKIQEHEVQWSQKTMKLSQKLLAEDDA
ncbi:glycosyltransferase family 2 protein [bacterium AH-315-I18]|nr:glycosyltransferase family 2 protein [Phycisphaeraceae bacterium]MBN4061199.1 glycosyltransferase family 2 protein [bacterium AH-315-I18]